MKKERGILVKTESGEKGVYYPDQPLINNKYPVTMLKDDLTPRLYQDKPVKKLFTSEQLKPIGFLN